MAEKGASDRERQCGRESMLCSPLQLQAKVCARGSGWIETPGRRVPIAVTRESITTERNVQARRGGGSSEQSKSCKRRV